MKEKLTKELWARIKNKKHVIHLVMGGTEDEAGTHSFDNSGECKYCHSKIWEGGIRMCSIITPEEVARFKNTE